MKNKLLLLTMGFALTIQIISAQVPSYVPTNGLSGWWGFSGNAKDASVNANNGIVNGATLTTDRFGNPNSAYSFDGSSNYIQIPNSSSLQNINKITISAWVNINSWYQSGGSGYFPILHKSDKQGQYGLYSLTLKDYGGIDHLGSQENGLSYPNWTFNNWYHVTLVIADNTNKVYVNGILVADTVSGVFPNSINNTLPLLIGIDKPGLVEYSNGKIDDIGIWNRALTQEEITAMYNGVEYSETCNAVSGSLVDGLVAYYPFCGNAKDASGNSNNGTVNGATLTTDRFGNANSAYNFNGTNAYINVQNNLLPNQQSYSINLWTKIEGNETIDLFNDRQEPSCFYKYRVLVINGVIQFWKYSNSSLEKVIGNAVPLNQWIMITAVFDNTQNTIKIYTNSLLDSLTSSSNWNVSQNTTTIGGLRGCSTNGIFNIQNGPIDDIGFWNRALSQVEISNLYNSNICYQNITVNDTLVINTGILSYNPVIFNNTVTIYPNPANDKITIDCGNLDNVNGWSIKIFNTLGQEVFSGAMNTQKYVLPLNTWGGQGIYFVKIYDSSNNLMNTKKIILN